MASVRFEHVSKNFDKKVQAVKNFNLEVGNKEFVVLIGPSGCGKTTVLRLLAGLEKPDEGNLYIADQLVNKVEPKDRSLALVNQTYALYPHLTVYRNIAFPLEVAKMPVDEIDRRVRAAAHLLELEPFLKQKPKTLSGGQMQRVAIGRSLVRSPKVFLMDEPFSNLDIQFRAGMHTQIQRLHERISASFLFVTHDQQEAMALADRIVVMNHGEVQQIDTPQNILQKPANMFVADFFGNSTINFMDTTLVSYENGFALQLEDLLLPIPAEKTSDPSVSDNLNRYLNQKVVLGIRPEDFSVRETALNNPKYPKLTARILRTEMQGGENYYYLQLQNTTFTARLGTGWSDFADGQIRVALNTDHIHIFDPESQQAICN